MVDDRRMMAEQPIATTNPNDRRAQNVATVGFLLQTVVFGSLVGLSIWKKSDTLAALARFVVAGIPIWFVLALVYKQVRRVSVERLESAELKRVREAGASEAIFDVENEELLIEQNRLHWLVRWLLPLTTVLLCIYLLAGHWIKWGWTFDNAFASEGVQDTQQPTMVMWFVVFQGFFCFLFARYCLALAKIPNWRLLHAGAIFIAATGLACLGEVIALMSATSIDWAEPLFAYIVRVAMLLLGIELVANFMLDFYRPRVPGVVARPSFDSRLLGLIGEPGALAKSIAEAVNYQFGFEVSSTWFYQLLQRWMLPIIVLTAIIILGLSSVVIVNADESAVIEHFGQPLTANNGVIGPGLHFKWPYPIDVVYRSPVRRVREIVVGESTEQEDENDPKQKAVLWTEAHEFVPHLMLLVASHDSEAKSKLPLSDRASAARGSAKSIERILEERTRATEAVPVSLLMVTMPIEYRVKDVRKYLYNYEDPVKLMEAVSYQYLSDYAASVDIDAILGAGRDKINALLKSALQQRIDRLDLGIEIVFAGIRAAHPPSKDGVAEAFEKVITASTGKATAIQNAEGESLKILTTVAGTEARARQLDDALRRRDRLRAQSNADPKELAGVEHTVNDLMMGNASRDIAPMSGEAAAIIADAKSAASQRVSEAAVKAQAFSAEVAAFESAKDLYTERKSLEVYDNISAVRKYLIVADPGKVVVEYQTQQEGGLDRVLQEGVTRERKESK